MSVEQTASGDFRVRWRDDAGRHRSQVVGPRKREADALDQEFKRARRLGLASPLLRQQKTFLELSEEWWKRHARLRAEKTQKGYAWILDTYLIPRYSGKKLGSIRVFDVEEWMADLADDLIGVEARRKALKLLRQILTKAIAWEYLSTNPADFVEMPRAVRMMVEPPEPVEIERLRGQLLLEGRQQDAALIGLMAYAGLRPHEAIALSWADVKDNAIRVREMKKVGAKGRTIRLLRPLAVDLAALKLQGPRAWTVLTNALGSEWTQTTFNNWRRRTFKRIAPDHRPYNLRHTFVSLLIAEGATVPEVSKQAGHGPELCLRTYAHLWDEYEKAGSAEAAIREARRAVADELDRGEIGRKSGRGGG